MRQIFTFRPSARRRIFLLVGVGVLTVGLAACSSTVSPTSSPPTSGGATPTATSTTTPTPSASALPSPSASASSPAAAPVNLEVLNARVDSAGSAITVSAMVTDRISNAGTCSLTVMVGGQTHTTEGPALADASVTYCGRLSVALPQGVSGPWDYTVQYSEPGFSGVVTGVVSNN
jgi:zona occludens toxin (predicted ATPase)